MEVVVAPGLVADLADQHGMRGVFLYSMDAVRQALDDAVEVVRIARIEAARRERLNTILAQLRDGVVAVDRQERIDALNPAMERVLGLSANRAIVWELPLLGGSFTAARWVVSISLPVLVGLTMPVLMRLLAR